MLYLVYFFFSIFLHLVYLKITKSSVSCPDLKITKRDYSLLSKFNEAYQQTKSYLICDIFLEWENRQQTKSYLISDIFLELENHQQTKSYLLFDILTYVESYLVLCC